MMRTFEDRAGRAWEVVVGRESWGAFFAIFVPRSGEEELLQALLPVDGSADAERLLGEMETTELEALLERAGPRSLG